MIEAFLQGAAFLLAWACGARVVRFVVRSVGLDDRLDLAAWSCRLWLERRADRLSALLNRLYDLDPVGTILLLTIGPLAVLAAVCVAIGRWLV